MEFRLKLEGLNSLKKQQQPSSEGRKNVAKFCIMCSICTARYNDIGSFIQHQKHLCVTTCNWNQAPKNSSVKLRSHGEKSWGLLVLSAAAEWIFKYNIPCWDTFPQTFKSRFLCPI